MEIPQDRTLLSGQDRWRRRVVSRIRNVVSGRDGGNESGDLSSRSRVLVVSSKGIKLGIS